MEVIYLYVIQLTEVRERDIEANKKIKLKLQREKLCCTFVLADKNDWQTDDSPDKKLQ